MSLTSAISIASSGIADIGAQLALVSQNVANASTPSYSVESIVAKVGAANSALGTIGSLSAQNVAQQAGQNVAQQIGGVSTADPDNQRDATVQELSLLLSVNAMAQANGNRVVTT